MRTTDGGTSTKKKRANTNRYGVDPSRVQKAENEKARLRGQNEILKELMRLQAPSGLITPPQFQPKTPVKYPARGYNPASKGKPGSRFTEGVENFGGTILEGIMNGRSRSTVGPSIPAPIRTANQIVEGAGKASGAGGAYFEDLSTEVLRDLSRSQTKGFETVNLAAADDYGLAQYAADVYAQDGELTPEQHQQIPGQFLKPTSRSLLINQAKRNGRFEELDGEFTDIELIRAAYKPKRSAVGNIAFNAFKDLATITTAWPAGVFRGIQAGLEGPEALKVFGKEAFVDPYINLAKDPMGELANHPLITPLMVSPAARFPGRTIGKVQSHRLGEDWTKRPDLLVDKETPNPFNLGGRRAFSESADVRALQKLVDRYKTSTKPGARYTLQKEIKEGLRRDVGNQMVLADKEASALSKPIKDEFSKMTEPERQKLIWSTNQRVTPDEWIDYADRWIAEADRRINAPKKGDAKKKPIDVDRWQEIKDLWIQLKDVDFDDPAVQRRNINLLKQLNVIEGKNREILADLGTIKVTRPKFYRSPDSDRDYAYRLDLNPKNFKKAVQSDEWIHYTDSTGLHSGNLAMEFGRDHGLIGPGFYLTNNPVHTQVFGPTQMRLKINPKNVLNMEQPPKPSFIQTIRDILKEGLPEFSEDAMYVLRNSFETAVGEGDYVRTVGREQRNSAFNLYQWVATRLGDGDEVPHQHFKRRVNEELAKKYDALAHEGGFTRGSPERSQVVVLLNPHKAGVVKRAGTGNWRQGQGVAKNDNDRHGTHNHTYNPLEDSYNQSLLATRGEIVGTDPMRRENVEEVLAEGDEFTRRTYQGKVDERAENIAAWEEELKYWEKRESASRSIEDLEKEINQMEYLGYRYEGIIEREVDRAINDSDAWFLDPDGDYWRNRQKAMRIAVGDYSDYEHLADPDGKGRDYQNVVDPDIKASLDKWRAANSKLDRAVTASFRVNDRADDLARELNDRRSGGSNAIRETIEGEKERLKEDVRLNTAAQRFRKPKKADIESRAKSEAIDEILPQAGTAPNRLLRRLGVAEPYDRRTVWQQMRDQEEIIKNVEAEIESMRKANPHSEFIEGELNNLIFQKERLANMEIQSLTQGDPAIHVSHVPLSKRPGDPNKPLVSDPRSTLSGRGKSREMGLLRSGNIDLSSEPFLRSIEMPTRVRRLGRAISNGLTRLSSEVTDTKKVNQTTHLVFRTNPDSIAQQEAYIRSAGRMDLKDLEDMLTNGFEKYPNQDVNVSVPGGEGWRVIDKRYVKDLAETLNERKPKVPESKWGKRLYRATDIWRYQALNLRPGYLLNNMIGNTLLAFMSGATPGDFWRARKSKIGDRDIIPPALEAANFNQATKNVVAEEFQRGFLGPIGRVGDWVMNQNINYENWARRATYLNRADKEAKREVKAMQNSPLGKIAKEQDPKAFKADAARLHEAALEIVKDREMNDPKLIDMVNDFLGDFSKPYNQRAFLIAPFYRWIGHIAKLALVTAPAKYPGRTTLLGLLGQQGLELMKEQGIDYRQDTLGALPLGEIPIAGGFAERIGRTQSQNPLATAYQTIPYSEDNTVNLGGLANTGNPLPLAFIDWASGKDMGRIDLPDNRVRDSQNNAVGGFDLMHGLSQIAGLAPLLNIIKPRVGKAGDYVPFINEAERYQNPDRAPMPQRPNDPINMMMRLFGITVDPIAVSGDAFEDQLNAITGAYKREFGQRDKPKSKAKNPNRDELLR